MVTVNRKDHLRYQRLYSGITVYFWLNWQVREMLIGRSAFAVAPLAGVWRAPFALLVALIEQRIAPLHAYQRRHPTRRSPRRTSGTPRSALHRLLLCRAASHCRALSGPGCIGWAQGWRRYRLSIVISSA